MAMTATTNDKNTSNEKNRPVEGAATTLDRAVTTDTTASTGDDTSDVLAAVEMLDDIVTYPADVDANGRMLSADVGPVAVDAEPDMPAGPRPSPWAGITYWRPESDESLHGEPRLVADAVTGHVRAIKAGLRRRRPRRGETPTLDGTDTLNGYIVAANDDAIRRLATDDVTNEMVWEPGFTPDWRLDSNTGHIVTDSDMVHLAARMRAYLGDIQDTVVKRTIAAYATSRARSFHRHHAALAALPAWDGQQRIEHLLDGATATAASDYVGAAMRSLWLGLVERILDPGCIHDEAVLLIGGQATRKTSFFRAIAEALGDASWCVDVARAPDPQQPDSQRELLMQLSGAVLCNFDEIDQILSRKTNTETLKSWLTARVFRIRRPYDRTVDTLKASHVCVGSTNVTDILDDASGSRRYLPVAITAPISDTTLDLDTLRQVWAEALHRYRAGERAPRSDDLHELAESARAAHAHSPVAELLDPIFNDSPGGVFYSCRTNSQGNAYAVSLDRITVNLLLTHVAGLSDPRLVKGMSPSVAVRRYMQARDDYEYRPEGVRVVNPETGKSVPTTAFVRVKKPAPVSPSEMVRRGVERHADEVAAYGSTPAQVDAAILNFGNTPDPNVLHKLSEAAKRVAPPADADTTEGGDPR